MTEFDLDDLREADPEFADVLIEACAGRVALARMIVRAVGAYAAARSFSAERERVCAHLLLARRGGCAESLAIAYDAIEGGEPADDVDTVAAHVDAARRAREERAARPMGARSKRGQA